MTIMESTSPPPQTATSRRRTTGGVKEQTTSEEQALNTIAKEAEARLAAKRAARAEARSIRMREISQRQKENEDGEVLGNDLPSNAATSPPTTTGRQYSLSRTSSRNEESSYDIADHASSDKLILSLKETIRQHEEKYKKAMVNTAQLDNERQALLYQVETLKDDIEELKERCENTDEELVHKTRDFNKLTREHNSTTAELNKALFIIQERERILDEHGINIDGTFKEGYSPVTTCTMCGGSLGDDRDENREEREQRGDREGLIAEISSLKDEIERLRLSRQNSDQLKRSMLTFDELRNANATNSQKSARIPSLRLLSQSIKSQNSVSDDEDDEVDSLPKSSLRISVDNYYADGASVASSASPSGSVTPTSNINISSYLGGDDHNDDNDDNEQRTAFRLSRYFSTDTEPVASSTGVDGEDDDETNDTIVDAEEGMSDDDVKTHLDVECVGVVEKHPSPRLAIEEDVVFAEEASHVMAAQDDQEYLENLDVVDPLFDTQQKLSKLSQPSRQSFRTMSTDSEVSMYYSILPGEENSLNSPDASMNTAFCDDSNTSLGEEDTEEPLTDNTEPQRGARLASDETLIIRSSVEELYNQIASEATEVTSTPSPQYLENYNPAFPPSGGPVSSATNVASAPPVTEPKGWKEWLESKSGKSESKSGKSTPGDSVDSGAEGDKKDKKKKKKKKK